MTRFLKPIDIAFYDLLHNFRSLFAIGMMFVAPLMMTGLIYFAFGGGSDSSHTIQPIKIAMVNLDSPTNGKKSMGQSMVELFEDSSVSQYVKIEEINGVNPALQAVNNQSVGAAIIIPDNFTAVVNRGKNDAEIRIVQDPTLTIGPAVLTNIISMYLDGINGFRIMIQLVVDNIQKSTKPVDNDSIMDKVNKYKDWFKDYQDTLFHSDDALAIKAPEVVSNNPASSGDNSSGVDRIMGMVLCGQMLFFTFYTGAYSMMSILREQEMGTLARLFTTPTSRLAVLAGKFIAVFLMVLVQSTVMLLVGAFFFNVHWGQPLNILLLTSAQVIAAGSLGVMLISFAKNSKQAGPILGAGLTLLGMLGGLFTANNQMPEVMTHLSLFTPQGWAISAWKLSMGGASTAEVIPAFLVLWAMGMVMFCVGAYNFRRRFA